LGHAVYYVYKY